MDIPDTDGRDESPEEGKCENDSKVSKEIFLHVSVPRNEIGYRTRASSWWEVSKAVTSLDGGILEVGAVCGWQRPDSLV